jgi:hypothetical protein
MTLKLPLIGPLVLCLAAGHAVLTWYHRDERPVLQVLTPPPDPWARTAAAAGDNQFLYRVWALHLQNAGDTGGRATPMRDYNYDFVLGWLATLQSLDNKSHLHTQLASDYFSLTPNEQDVRRITAFVLNDVALHPEQKWPWAIRAIQIATSRLKDYELALAISRDLNAYNVPDMPYGALSLPAVFLESLGRYAEARDAVEVIREKYADKMTADDIDWTDKFIQRLPAT